MTEKALQQTNPLREGLSTLPSGTVRDCDFWRHLET